MIIGLILLTVNKMKGKHEILTFLQTTTEFYDLIQLIWARVSCKNWMQQQEQHLTQRSKLNQTPLNNDVLKISKATYWFSPY